MRTRPARDRSIQLLRLVPGESPLHRMWPGTKLGIVVLVGIAAVIRPNWTAASVMAAGLALGFVASRVPRAALPLPPTWLAVSLVATGALALFAGGPPAVDLGPVTVEMGGLVDWLLFTTLLVEAFAAAALVGWTTHMGDLGRAVAALTRPLARIGIPVESAVAAMTLGLRCLPLLLDEFRTLVAAWRNRRPLSDRSTGRRERSREAILQAHDILAGALASSLRRAHEMAEAMEARGGLRGPVPGRIRLGRVDAVAWVVALVGVVVILWR